LLLGLATFSIIHIFIEIVVYPLMTPSHDEILAGHLSIPYPQALSTSKDEDAEEPEVPLSEWQKSCVSSAQSTTYSTNFSIVARRHEIRY